MSAVKGRCVAACTSPNGHRHELWFVDGRWEKRTRFAGGGQSRVVTDGRHAREFYELCECEGRVAKAVAP